MATSPDYAYWFLWVLFLNCILLSIVYKFDKYIHLKNVKYKTEILAVLVCLLVNILNKRFQYLGVGLLSWHCVFYLSGHFIAKYKNTLYKHRYVIGIISAFIWILLVPFWRRAENPTYVGIYRKVIGWVLGRSITEYRYIIGFSGSAMVMLIVYMLGKYWDLGFLDKIGQRTIEIYVLQSYCFIFSFTNNNKTVEIFQNIITGLFLPYIISEIFERHLERRIIFGKP